MKRFNISVNGKAYDVCVEEVGAAGAAMPAAPASAPAAVPAPAAAPAPAAPKAAGAGEKISAPMPGNIMRVDVKEGDSIKKGDVIVILEAMKMENEIMAPCDGTVTSVVVKKGDTVDTGALIATIQ